MKASMPSLVHQKVSERVSVLPVYLKMSFFSYSTAVALLLISIALSALVAASTSNFYQDVDINFGDHLVHIQNGGQLLTLSLYNYSGSGFQSKNEYIFGRFDMQIKLVPGNSAGTVITFFLSSQGSAHDEIDFEFLGNTSGEPYTLHTNVYAQGNGNKEEQFHLWFDPAMSFHSPHLLNSTGISCSNFFIFVYYRFFVDNIPIRVFNNNEAVGTPFPTTQPMRVYCSLWNADEWATQGGRVKTDWTKAPFFASYKNFNANACIHSSTDLSSISSCPNSLNTQAWQTQELDAIGRRRLRWVQRKYRIYNYCFDQKRFPQGLPPECKHPRS